MNLSANLVFGNRLEHLADALGEKIFNASLHPLQNRIVIVPSQNTKRFLLLHFASDPKWGVAAGAQIVTLPQALRQLVPQQKIPSALELSLRIESEIRWILQQPKESLFSPLWDYFDGKSQKRIRSFSDELSDLFLKYGTEDRVFFESWKKENGWQQTMWDRIFSSGGKWSYPLEILSQPASLEIPLFLFGFNYLHDVYVKFFKEQGAHFFLLSPCQMFWEDIESDRRRLSIKRSLKNRGVPEAQREELDRYLKERNRLLANWGKLGREMLALFGDEGNTEEYYESAEENSLQKLQSDILFLRSSSDFLKDDSLELHAAPTKQREVEILYNNICNLLNGDPQIELRQILVMAPDIALYAPYIHALFAGMNYQISDLEAGAQSSFLQAFKLLLSLPEKRFECTAVLSLLSEESFLKKFSLAPEEASLIKKWMRAADVRWGLDQEQREGLFRSSYGETGAMEGSGTWQHGVDRLIWGMILLGKEDEPFAQPLAEVEFTDAELLGKWTEVIELLKVKLKPLYIEGEKRSFADWVAYIKGLAESFFAVAPDEEPLFQELTELAHIDTLPIDFSSVDHILERLLKKRSGSFQSNQVEAIRFCSFKPGSPLPAQALFLLGMDEDSFPRQERRSSLSAHEQEKVRKIDEERYLFLETLLSARRRCIMSYVNYSEKDEKERGPSLLIQELLSEVKSLQPVIHKPRRHTRRERAFFFPAFHQKMEIAAEERKEEIVVDIKDLSKCARHPIQFYIQKQLGIYLSSQEESSEFLLSYLELSLFRKASLKVPIETLIDRADKQGSLPSGTLKRLAIDKIKEDAESYEQTLRELGVQKEELFSVTLNAAVRQPSRDEKGNFLLPPLEVALEGGRRAVVIGKLSDLSPRGMLFHGKDEIADRFKAWPLFLLYQKLSSFGVPAAPALFLTKAGIALNAGSMDIEKQLAKFINYYELALEHPSPLMPAFAESILNTDSKELAKTIKQSFSGQLGYDDEYLSWLAARDPLPNADAILQNWGEHLSPLLLDIEARFSNA